jgi:hypothetical protein
MQWNGFSIFNSGKIMINFRWFYITLVIDSQNYFLYNGFNEMNFIITAIQMNGAPPDHNLGRYIFLDGLDVLVSNTHEGKGIDACNIDIFFQDHSKIIETALFPILELGLR